MSRDAPVMPRRVTCRQVARRLQRYLDGLETGRWVSRDHIAAHLEACRRCGLEARTYEALKASLARQPVPVPDDVRRRLDDFGRSLTD